MTYYESYKALSSVQDIKRKMMQDAKVAIFLGGNPDRIKAIEDAGNKAIQEIEGETMTKVEAHGDVISRQDAIDLCDWYDNPSMHDDLMKLPPANQWIPCSERLPEKPKMDDLVKRSDVFEAFSDVLDQDFPYKSEETPRERIESIPPAQSEQPFEIQEILDYLDKELHPIVSPEHWNVYAELHDMISMLPSAQTEQTKMIKEIREWINSENRGSADYFIVDKVEEIINEYESIHSKGEQ